MLAIPESTTSRTPTPSSAGSLSGGGTGHLLAVVREKLLLFVPTKTLDGILPVSLRAVLEPRRKGRSIKRKLEQVKTFVGNHVHESISALTNEDENLAWIGFLHQAKTALRVDLFAPNDLGYWNLQVGAAPLESTAGEVLRLLGNIRIIEDLLLVVCRRRARGHRHE